MPCRSGSPRACFRAAVCSNAYCADKRAISGAWPPERARAPVSPADSGHSPGQRTVSESMQLLLLLLAWLAIAVGCHASIRRYYLATFTAAFVMVAALQLASYLQIGKPDPLWPLSSLVGFCLAVIVALAAGLPFRVRRIIRDHYDSSDST